MLKRKASPVNASGDREQDRLRSQILGISIIALVTLLLAGIRYYFNLG